MSDNVTIPATGTGTATPVIATDDVGGVQYQRVKLDVGADGATTPVVGTLPVSGTVAVSNALALDATVVTTNTEVGIVTETAPATDTASSGLNGRLQRIAQRLTSIIGLLPAALGAGGGLKVDGSGTALPVSGTVTAVSATATNLKVDASGVAVPVTDNAGSLTVDSPQLPAALGSGGGIKVDGSGTAVPVSLTTLPALVAGSAVIGVTVPQATATVANGQVNVTGTPATLVAQRTTRSQLTIVNRQVAPIFVGIATVTTSNGFQIDPGASLTLYTTALIQGVTAANSGASEKTHYVETY